MVVMVLVSGGNGVFGGNSAVVEQEVEVERESTVRIVEKY